MKALRAIGRRGYSLIFFAILFGTIGFSLVTAPTPAVKIGSVFEALPLDAWGGMWLGAALLSILAIFCKRCDAVAFGVMSALMCVWAAGYIALAIEQDLPNVYIGAVIYLAFAAFIQVIAGWPEPKDKP